MSPRRTELRVPKTWKTVVLADGKVRSVWNGYKPKGEPMWSQSPQEPYYPDIEFEITDGNSLGELGRAMRALRTANVSTLMYRQFYAEVLRAGSYGAFLQVLVRWFNTQFTEKEEADASY